MTFAKRGTTIWKLKSQSLTLGTRTRVMGILNVTPDSFSDGGSHFDALRAIDHGLAMFADGADIIDIGGESTRPGKHDPETAATEQARVMPVIAGILRAHLNTTPAPILSIDTYHAETALAAITAGVEIVNDVSGFTWDPAMARICARLACGVVLMHTRGRPDEWKLLPPHRAGRSSAAGSAASSGNVCSRLSPQASSANKSCSIRAFGFGKAFDENYPLLAGMESLRSLGQPLLAGVSRKSFLGRTLAELHHGVVFPAAARGNASIAAMVASILAGADVVRVHDVKPAVEAARIADAVLAAAAQN